MSAVCFTPTHHHLLEHDRRCDAEHNLVSPVVPANLSKCSMFVGGAFSKPVAIWFIGPAPILSRESKEPPIPCSTSIEEIEGVSIASIGTIRYD